VIRPSGINDIMRLQRYNAPLLYVMGEESKCVFGMERDGRRTWCCGIELCVWKVESFGVDVDVLQMYDTGLLPEQNGARNMRR
jgi:hypothetical protein